MNLIRFVLIFFLISSAQAAYCEDSKNPKAATPPELQPEFPLFDEGSLLDQVIMQSDAPKIYDWRNAPFELELGFDDVSERNVFPSQGCHLGAGFSVGGGYLIRTGLRRITVKSSPAGQLIEKTPFRQPGQPTRWEAYGLIEASLLEGRTSSKLSPLLTDFESVFSAGVGLHYVHPSATFIPTKKGSRERVPGQSVGVSVWALDLEFRYQIYLPSGFGAFVTSGLQFPVSYISGPLAQWSNFTIGGVYAFSASSKP